MLTSKTPDGLAVQLSRKKLEALKELSRLGAKLSDGYDYVLWEYVSPKTTLDDVRNRMSVIKTPVSKEIIEERNRQCPPIVSSKHSHCDSY